MKRRNQLKTERQVRAALRGGANVVPLVRELPADMTTPVAAFLRLARPGEPAFLLESVEGGERYARYSFLGARPFETISVANGAARVRRAGRDIPLGGCPFRALGQRLGRYRASHEPGLPRFCGGAVGFVGYEMIRHLEPTVALRPPEGDEARLMLFADVAAFDRLRQRMLLISNVVADGSVPVGRAYRKACDALDRMERRLSRPLAPERPGRPAPPRRPKAALGQAAFLEGVRRLKGRIRAGDIFQAVLSDRFEVPLRAEPFEVYRKLRAINPSPYMFFMGTADEALLGASPEMLVRVEDRVVETQPIAGTRPRGADEEEDSKNERDLLASVKERAEHLMLVDLGRNDVGRVARPGSVRVPSFMRVERFSHVMHLVSSVRGRLRRGCSAWDAFGACFPAGTVTGAPKIRAMQLVNEIEPVPRGFYAGAVLYHDFQGNLDSAIAIRSLMVRGKGRSRAAVVQAGAGIVADSRPVAELREIRAKSRAMFEAIRSAEGT
ncbi:MAG: chorismate-binding protein [Elusimicrobiota bacterium]